MRTRALSIAVAVAACGQSAPPAPRAPAAVTPAPAPLPAWSEATFAANVRAELARRFPGATVDTIEADRLRVQPKAGDPMEVSFAKAHASCRQDWASCGAAVDHTLTALAEISSASTITRAQLRVVLRATEKVATIKARVSDILVRPFSSDAQWILAADLPNTIRLDVTPHDVGLSGDDAWRIATANVKPKEVVTQSVQGFIVYQDDYAPSALLYPDLLLAAARQALPGRAGNLLVTCPEENIVLYTIGGAGEAKQLRDAAAAGSQGSTMPLSSHVMEWTGSEWREAL